MSVNQIGLKILENSSKVFFRNFRVNAGSRPIFGKIIHFFVALFWDLNPTNSQKSDIFNILLFLAIMVQLPLCMDGNFVWRTCIGMYLPKKIENFSKNPKLSKNSKNCIKSALQGMFSICINFGDLGIPL